MSTNFRFTQTWGWIWALVLTNGWKLLNIHEPQKNKNEEEYGEEKKEEIREIRWKELEKPYDYHVN